MAKLIACCGLDCNACEARVAAIKNDNESRAKLAARMQAHYINPKEKTITRNTLHFYIIT